MDCVLICPLELFLFFFEFILSDPNSSLFVTDTFFMKYQWEGVTENSEHYMVKSHFNLIPITIVLLHMLKPVLSLHNHNYKMTGDSTITSFTTLWYSILAIYPQNFGIKVFSSLSLISSIQKNHNTKMNFYPSEPVINESLLERKDWSNSVYASGDFELKEALTSVIPKGRENGFTMTLYVGSDYAKDSVKRWSRTIFCLFV